MRSAIVANTKGPTTRLSLPESTVLPKCGTCIVLQLSEVSVESSFETPHALYRSIWGHFEGAFLVEKVDAFPLLTRFDLRLRPPRCADHTELGEPRTALTFKPFLLKASSAKVTDHQRLVS
jgi:hypothetical protein